jgi:hypothetical protein
VVERPLFFDGDSNPSSLVPVLKYSVSRRTVGKGSTKTKMALLSESHKFKLTAFTLLTAGASLAPVFIYKDTIFFYISNSCAGVTSNPLAILTSVEALKSIPSVHILNAWDLSNSQAFAIS